MAKIFQQRTPGTSRRRPLVTAGIVAGGGLALCIVIFGALWGIAMPVRDLPEPTGPHTVGTVSYDLVDSGRMDPYRVAGSSAPAARTLRLQLWYPADHGAAAPNTVARPAPWMADGPEHTRAIVRSHGFPFFIWEHTRWMDSNSYRSAPPGGPPRYPVAIIVHGWEGYRALHADIAEDLASHGFLVAAADHSYGAAATRLADGTVLRSREDVLPERDTTDHFARYAAELVETFSRDIGTIREHVADIAGGARGTATAETTQPGGVHLGQATPGEDRAALAQLAGRIDVERLVLVGHSTGGGAAVHHTLGVGSGAARRARMPAGTVSAIVGLDAWVEPLGRAQLAEADPTLPALFLRSEQWIGGINDSYLVPFIDRLQEAGAPVELRQMDDITHEQFSTLYMYAPATRWVGLLGDETDPMEFAEVQRTAIREFVIASHH